jgi:Protein of unknown function (DUF3089)
MAGVSREGRLICLAVGLAATVCLAVAAAPASARTVWLCKPGATFNPCLGSLQTTVVDPSGQSRVENPSHAKRPRIDCFYVYPTVSDDQSLNSDLSIDPEVVAIALYQASRFSERCRVFAPMYRQLTLRTIGGDVPPDAVQTAYADVRSAWREYMRRFNNGRGVVLIGHSQGAGMLQQLIRQKVDRFRKARQLLVSAILLGGNVTVQEGRNVGGIFRRIPACRTAKRTACVIAYSVFNQTPPDNAVFGKPGGSFAELLGLSGRTDLEVLCTNPAALRGGPGPLHSLAPTAPFPGTIGIGVRVLYNGSPPIAPTPWVEPQDHYSGQCVEANGANVLLTSPIGPARQLTPVPDASWGLHLADVNIALGNLVGLVGSQTKPYLRQRAKRKRLGR